MSGTITNTNNLRLEIAWEEASQNIVQNTTSLKLIVSLYHRYNIYWAATRTGSLVADGTSHPFSIGSVNRNGEGRIQLLSTTVTIPHNSNGSKTVALSASFPIDFVWNGTSYGTISISGNVTLTTIGRATEINSASFSSNLAAGTANSLTISLDRKSTSFRHDISIRDGSTVLRSVTGQTNPTSISLSAAQVNAIINRMGSVTNLKKNFTVRVVTKASSASNAATIGTRNVTITGTLDNASTRPSFSSGTSSVHGSGFDSSIDRYVQTISRASLTAVASPGQGATMASMTATINNGGTVSNNRSGNTWTGTTGVLNRSGTYTVTVTATNSRGQTRTRNITISVLAYSPPSITTFTVVRTTGTNARVTRATSYSSLSGLNQQRLTVERRLSTGTSWTTMTNSSTGWLSTNINNNFLESGNTASRSYVYLATVEDRFGNTSTSQVSLSTSSVLMSFNKDIGIGMGKMHEQGTLDIAGNTYIDGSLFVTHDGTTAEIIASGSNDNGEWIRYANGTQICWGTNITQLTTTNSSGSIYTSTSYLLRYARNFVGSAPALQVNTRLGNSNWATTGSVTTSGSYVYLMGPIQDSSGHINYIAIGRWKE